MKDNSWKRTNKGLLILSNCSEDIPDGLDLLFEPPLFLKQSLHKTGLSPEGLNGT